MTVIQNGNLVLPDGVKKMDIAFENGVISQISPSIEGGDDIVQAEGCFVFPGFIDGHTHLDMDSGTMVTADDFKSGTMAAAAGGTTTILDFATQDKGGSLQQALNKWHEKARDKCAVNYAFHMAITDWNDRTKAELDAMAEQGVTSFKAYYAYDALRVNDREMLQILQALKPIGGILGVHCENGDLVNELQAQQKLQSNFEPSAHPKSRPPVVEAEAVRRLLAVAKLADSQVNIVHLSSEEGLEEIRRARAAGMAVWAETCPQYLVLDESYYDLPNFQGAKYVMSPPLRAKADQEALRRAVIGGEIDTIATDHCSYNFETQKMAGKGDFTKIPNGAPGIEHRPVLFYTTFVAEGTLTERDMARMLSENPAKLFGLWPKKGQLAVGADADITVWNPNEKGVIQAKHQHQAVDYTPYEGFKTIGRAEKTFVGGVLAAEKGKPTGCIAGKYVKR